ncbi:hypothetical protein D9M71_408720 [compost metagenome]
MARRAAPAPGQHRPAAAAAAWRAPGRPGKGPVPRHQGAAFAQLPGHLPLGPGVGRQRCAGAPGHPRHLRMAARQGARPVGAGLSLPGGGRYAGHLSLHRRQHRRGLAGQAARARGDHQPCHADLLAGRAAWRDQPASRPAAPVAEHERRRGAQQERRADPQPGERTERRQGHGLGRRRHRQGFPGVRRCPACASA